MSAKPESAPEAGPPPPKSKKLLIIVGALVLVLILAGGAAYFFISKQRAAAAADAEGGETPTKAATAHASPGTPPAYLPLDNMVVNLADPGGERVAQVGITLEVQDSKASDSVKAYLPTIRSGILMLISQRTADELLKSEGKEKLAKDILRETAIPFGGGDDDHAKEDSGAKATTNKKKGDHAEYPVKGVLFSSFIIQ